MATRNSLSWDLCLRKVVRGEGGWTGATPSLGVVEEADSVEVAGAEEAEVEDDDAGGGGFKPLSPPELLLLPRLELSASSIVLLTWALVTTIQRRGLVTYSPQ